MLQLTPHGGTRYGIGSPRQRHDDCDGASGNPSSSRERKGRGQALGHQPHDGAEVALAPDQLGCADGTEGAPLQRAQLGGRGGHRRLRRHTLLPLDDCLYALQPSLPHLTRSSLHRCLQHHGISRLPEVDGDKPKRSRFKAYPIGYFHIDIAQVSTEQGKLHLFVAIDRTSKFAFVQLHEKATQRIAAAFLHDLVAAVPYTIHTVLTDNGIQFADNHPVDEEAEAKAAAYWAERDEPRIYRWHSFEWACEQTKIEHRLTKPRCPWTTDEVEQPLSAWIVLFCCHLRATA